MIEHHFSGREKWETGKNISAINKVTSVILNAKYFLSQ